MKFLFVLAQLGATFVRTEAWSKMHFADCAALAAVLFHYFNSKFETLLFCWGWDCS